MRYGLLVLSSLTLTLLAAARCAPDDERREAERATARAERVAGESTLTSATLEREGALGVSDATRRQQDAYRAVLRREIDALDDRLAGAGLRGPGHRQEIEGRRRVLKAQLDALARTTQREWPALKAQIDRDLGREVNP